jgi:hypothetical protein
MVPKCVVVVDVDEAVPGRGGVLQGTLASLSLQVCEINGLREDVSGDWKTDDLRVLGGEG